MRHLTFTQTQNQAYPIVLLVPEINREAILDAYVRPFEDLNQEELLVLSLHQDQTKKKTSSADMKRYVEEELIDVIRDVSAEYLLVADAEYFKLLTRATKVEANLGYVLDCAYGPQKVAYVPNYRAIFYDPQKVRSRIAQGMGGFLSHRAGTYALPGADIIHSARYPSETDQILRAIGELHRHPELTCDIEAFSLKHHTAGIGTITFCWDKHNGCAFPVDYRGRDQHGELLSSPDAGRVRQALREFFETYQGRLTYHSIAFDVYVLIFQLFMRDILDTEGLLRGLDVMLRNWDCTKLITYLATNSCSGNRLGLKDQSQEFSGNYSLGEDIKDITQVPLERLLEYNLIDGLSTWYVKEKHEPTVDADGQREIYEELFKPAIRDIIQMQLTGMPVNMTRALEVNDKLASEEADLRTRIAASPIVRKFELDYLEPAHIEKRNSTLKSKRIQAGDEPQVFNPASDLQMRGLLFDWLQLPVINLTDSKLPSTDGESIEALINRVEDPELRELLETFQLFAIIGTLTSNFMPSILGATLGPDGWHYLFGNFNLGGTLSGRLSSSGPNLQNLPSTGKGHRLKLVYAKLIKSCFQAPPGWLFVGADFPSLEDRISALTTKDPNKLSVYQGHIIYEVDLDGVLHHIRDDDTIIYDGRTYNGQQFYEAHRSL